MIARQDLRALDLHLRVLSTDEVVHPEVRLTAAPNGLRQERPDASGRSVPCWARSRRQASTNRALAVATLRSATTTLSGTYSFVQVGIGGTHDDVWPGSGEAHPIAGATHMVGFHARTAQTPITPMMHPAKRRTIDAA